jgi:hypothetical protein
MTADTDTIHIPDMVPVTRYLKLLSVNRGVAKQLVTSKGNSKAIYNLSLQHGISLQAAGYLSRCRLTDIENATKII